MNIAPPDESAIEERMSVIRGSANRKITRRHRGGLIAAGLLLAGAGALGGAGVATASFPVTVDMQGVVKTKYVDAFVECSEAAGVETVVLTGQAAVRVLEDWTDIDIDKYTAIELRMDDRNQARLGRAVTECQSKIAAEVGEPIT